MLPKLRTGEERQASPYERNNLWMLERSLECGVQKVHFICVWDGQAGDGPGGARHMYEAVRAAGGDVEQPIHPLGSKH
ncbi:hypothetical protein [Paraburkholderia aromaticivorans]|uniref:hypothetical protein n=1 Tax=Paraburkholderia aromaticivorans TaxID=2026199 RepID=UPI0014561CC4|nr:hypothetical protein [Paraburkholderia aromaticivorans]